MLLDASWVLRRLAFEAAGRVYGEDFHSSTLGLSDGLLGEMISPGASVLDVGCGTGRWCRAAAPFAGSIVGIDYDGRAIEAARRATSHENISYIKIDASTHLEQALEGRRFDLVLLIHVIEHIDDVDSFLASLHAIAPTVIAEVPDFEAEPLNSVRLRLGTIYFSDADHVREYTEAVLRDQLTRNGWHVQKVVKRGGAVLAVASSTPVL